MKRKHKMLNELNFKLNNSNQFTYEETENFIKFNIENCMKYFNKIHPEYNLNSHEQMFNKVRKQLLKRDILRLKNAQSQQIN